MELHTEGGYVFKEKIEALNLDGTSVVILSHAVQVKGPGGEFSDPLKVPRPDKPAMSRRIGDASNLFGGLLSDDEKNALTFIGSSAGIKDSYRGMA